MFVRNVSQSINKDQLLEQLTPHANITSVFIVKNKDKGPNYGFVSVPTEDDRKKFMYLKNKDFYLSGKKLMFQPIHRRFATPTDRGFFRPKLPDGDFDLKPVNTNEHSIHVLCNDVMIKILEYLPLKERILCEIVCRRWQALIYLLFENTLHLNLSPYHIMINSIYDEMESKIMLSKLLLLTGETLKYLYISETEYSLKKDMFLMIAQLCPNLEYLDLSCYLDYYKNDYEWPKRGFSAFFYWANDMRSKVRAANPDLGVGELAKELNRQWNEASENEMSPYKKIEREDRARYDAEWKACKAGESPLFMKKTNTHNVLGIELASSAFLYYADKERCKIRAENPDFSISAVYRESGRRWNELSETDKAPFVKIAEGNIVVIKNEIEESYLDFENNEGDDEESKNEIEESYLDFENNEGDDEESENEIVKSYFNFASYGGDENDKYDFDVTIEEDDEKCESIWHMNGVY